VIIGNPSCADSSQFLLSRKKELGDPNENANFKEFVFFVNELQPSIFFMENLPKMALKVPFQPLFHGYHLHYFSVSVAALGNSQKSRVRLFMIGSKDEKITKRFARKFAKMMEDNSTQPLLTVDQILDPKLPFTYVAQGGTLSDSLDISGAYTEDYSSTIALYGGCKMRLDKIREEWLFGSQKDNSKWKIDNPNSKMHSAPGVYINRKGKLPMTVRKTNRQFDFNGRQMTPRQLGYIQGIPSSFGIVSHLGLKNNPCYWINKGRATVANTPPYEWGEFLYSFLLTL
jgi:site-specific DNA-cytosine methylase